MGGTRKVDSTMEKYLNIDTNLDMDDIALGKASVRSKSTRHSDVASTTKSSATQRPPWQNEFADNNGASVDSLHNECITQQSGDYSRIEKECDKLMQNGFADDNKENHDHEEAKSYERPQIRLIKCSNCGRNFKDSALAKHMRLCK